MYREDTHFLRNSLLKRRSELVYFRFFHVENFLLLVQGVVNDNVFFVYSGELLFDDTRVLNLIGIFISSET